MFIIDDLGVQRFLGNLSAPGGLTRAWPTYGDTPETPLIPRSQWSPVDLSRFMSPVKNQGQIGACNAFDTCYLLEGCRRGQGRPDVTLSPGYLYGHINGGVDQGSLLEDAMRWMMDHGTCTSATVGERDWQSRPAGAAEEASRYRVLEAFLCPTFDHLASAVQCGFLVSAGVLWYANYVPDPDGWLPARGRGQAGGHAICRCSLEQRGGVWGLGGPNSWGDGWGKAGYFVMPESEFSGPIGGWWAVRSVVDEGGVVPVAEDQSLPLTPPAKPGDPLPEAGRG